MGEAAAARAGLCVGCAADYCRFLESRGAASFQDGTVVAPAATWNPLGKISRCCSRSCRRATVSGARAVATGWFCTAEALGSHSRTSYLASYGFPGTRALQTDSMSQSAKI